MAQSGERVGQRRSEAWWEPTFSPDLEGKLVRRNWNFENSTGPKDSYLSATDLTGGTNDGEVQKFENVTFERCDIQGNFEHRPAIVFKKCRFHDCDFSFSEWMRASFSACEFKKCSFALTLFEECEFRDCVFEEIGLQGSKTDFIRTFINNPKDFVSSGFSGRRSGHPNPYEHALYQAHRLEASKAQVARTLLASHKEVGDDKTYYESARLHDIQELKSKIYRDVYNIAFGKGIFNRLKGLFLIPHSVEIGLLIILGMTNGWGATILRPIFGLSVIYLIFGLLYAYCDGLGAGDHPWQMSFDITTIAGYTNQSSPELGEPLRITQGVQLVVSIVLYTVFFATAISRHSRSRS